jgi:23S rRNA pseudouridine1911/1915/1917 synthase
VPRGTIGIKSLFRATLDTPLQTLSVLYEDNHLLVVNKPCGIATMGTKVEEASLARSAAEYLKHKYNKPGNVFVGVVSRLDAFASGVIALARTSKAASRLSEQIRSQTTSKRYLVWVEACVKPSESPVLLEDYLIKNDPAHRIEVASRSTPGAQLAQMRYRCILSSPQYSVLEVELLTGRKHQIRVQLAARDMTVYADAKYGSKIPWRNSIGLHCYRNVVQHPTQGKQICFQCWPSHWREKLGSSQFESMLGRIPKWDGAEGAE